MPADTEVDEITRLKSLPELREMDEHLFGANDLLSAATECTALLLVVGPEPRGTDYRPTKLVTAIEEVIANARQEAVAIPRRTRGGALRCEMLAAAGELFRLADQAMLERKYGIEVTDAAVRAKAFALNDHTKTGLKRRAVVWVRLTHTKTAERRMWVWYNALLEELHRYFSATAGDDRLESHPHRLDILLAKVAGFLTKPRDEEIREYKRRKPVEFWLNVFMIMFFIPGMLAFDLFALIFFVGLVLSLAQRWSQ